MCFFNMSDDENNGGQKHSIFKEGLLNAYQILRHKVQDNVKCFLAAGSKLFMNCCGVMNFSTFT